MNAVTGPTQHSDLGASSMYRWSQCPGSFNLIRSLPAQAPSPPSIYAATGTLAHGLIDEAIKGRQTRFDVGTLLGTTYKVGPHSITPDQDFVAGIQMMLDYVTNGVTSNMSVQSEMRVNLRYWFDATGIVPPVKMFATSDVVMADRFAGEIEIIDYKNGAGIFVPVEGNPQLLYYAAGVLAEVIMKMSQPEQFRRIKITVVQPHAPGGPPIRSQVLDIVDVMLWIDDVLIPAVEACSQPDAPLVHGSWCRFCPAAYACPMLMEAAKTMSAKNDFSQYMIPATPEEMAEQLALAEKASAWVDAIRTYATEQLKSQMRIPGWGLEPTRPTRRWANTDAVLDKFLLANLPLDATHDFKLKTPAQMEKALKTHALVPNGWWDQNMTPLIENYSSGVKLARTTKSTTDFTEYTEE